MRLLARTSFEVIESGAFQSLVRDLEQDWLQLLPRLSRREVTSSGHHIQKARPEVMAAELEQLHARIR
jgi:hypothetical protein